MALTIELARRTSDLHDGLHDWQAEEGTTEAAMLTVAIEAQTVATLALVEEQRTTNLIAWFATANPSQEMQKLIERRLGIQ